MKFKNASENLADKLIKDLTLNTNKEIIDKKKKNNNVKRQR